MYYSGVSTSLLLIVTGAILAFAVTAHVNGMNVNAIGWILLVVGILGLLLSFAFLGEYSAWPRRRRYYDHVGGPDDYAYTPPHEHRRVETKDVVYDDDADGTRVERIRRTSPR